MAFQVSRSELMKAANRASALQARAKRVMEKAETIVSTVVGTVEVGTGAFVTGMITGKWGNLEVVGVPVELMAGAALHLGGFVLGDKPMASHLHRFGDGAVAGYLSSVGKGIGVAWKAKAGAALQGDSLTPEERARLNG